MSKGGKEKLTNKQTVMGKSFTSKNRFEYLPSYLESTTTEGNRDEERHDKPQVEPTKESPIHHVQSIPILKESVATRNIYPTPIEK